MRTKILIIALALVYTSTFAQDISKTVENSANQKVNNDASKTVNDGINAVEKGIKGLFKKKSTAQQQTQTTTNNQNSTTTLKKDTVPSSSSQNNTPTQSLQSFTQYDFVPGDTILFYEDFSQDAIGDFPDLWTTNATGEVRNLNLYMGKWLYQNSVGGVFSFINSLNIPQNFIMEFDLVNHKIDGWFALIAGMYFTSDKNRLTEITGDEGFTIYFGNNSGYNKIQGSGYGKGYHQETQDIPSILSCEKIEHIIIWVQKRRVRVYHEGKKVMDAPTLLPENCSFNRLAFKNTGVNQNKHELYISNIKITTAAPDTRSKLLTEGKLISYGIYFDVNKDVVKPESYGALKDIAQVLKDNPSVRVKIVGHTDSDGDANLNIDLSKRRGASVKNELINTFGIDASRLESDGMGATQPVAPNDTPANKAKNRRVEFIKIN